jgi:HlyD family secretion protein
MLYAASIVAAFLIAYYVFRPKPVEVEIAEVVRGSLEVTVNEFGKTRVKERYVVSSPLAGELMRIALRPGDAVVAGETVVAVVRAGDPSLLDSRARAEAESAVKLAEAKEQHARTQQARSKATYDLAVAQLERTEMLLSSDAVSRHEYEVALHDVRTAAQTLQGDEFLIKISEYETEMARVALQRTFVSSEADHSFEVRSPINGVVLRVYQESETQVETGTRLLELGDLGQIEIEVDVLTDEAVRIKRGAKMYVMHHGIETPMVARVRLVEPGAFQKISALGVEEQRVKVIADFEEAIGTQGELGDAYQVDVRVVVWEKEVLKIPSGALFRRGNVWVVYRVEEGRAMEREVQVGEGNGSETEVISGLTSAERIIVYPSELLKNGSAVVIRKNSGGTDL